MGDTRNSAMWPESPLRAERQASPKRANVFRLFAFLQATRHVQARWAPSSKTAVVSALQCRGPKSETT